METKLEQLLAEKLEKERVYNEILSRRDVSSGYERAVLNSALQRATNRYCQAKADYDVALMHANRSNGFQIPHHE